MANEIYVVPETALTWLASGGDNALTLTSLGGTAGRQGALDDFGTAARSRKFMWRAYVKFSAAPTVGLRIGIFWKTSDGTHPDNDDGTGDIAVSAADKLLNLRQLGSIIVDEASSTPEFVASGEFEFSARYGAPVFWNYTGTNLSATAADHGFILTPVPDQIQAA